MLVFPVTVTIIDSNFYSLNRRDDALYVSFTYILYDITFPYLFVNTAIGYFHVNINSIYHVFR
jgi:hypothetical protein